VVVGLAAVLICSLIAGARLVNLCHGNPGCFVVPGVDFVDPQVSGLPARGGNGATGYDGQFFWRLARSPTRLDLKAVDGVRLDSYIRVGRPGYPALAWLAALGGEKELTDWALIVVNLVSAGVLAALLASVAAKGGHSVWFGLAGALWPGLLLALGRDLSEVTAATFVVLGLFLLDRRKPGSAALAWSAAVLTREQSLVVPVAFGIWSLWRLVRHRAVGRDVVAWSVPVFCFVAWQVVVRVVTGVVPFRGSANRNAVVPLTALGPAAWDWLVGRVGPVGGIWLLELAVLVALVGVTIRRLHHRWEVLAVVLGSLVLLSASSNVWSGPAHFRYGTDLVALCWFALLREPAGKAVTTGRHDFVLNGLAASELVVAFLATTFIVRAA
jgi:hypothetical protein